MDSRPLSQVLLVDKIMTTLAGVFGVPAALIAALYAGYRLFHAAYPLPIAKGFSNVHQPQYPNRPRHSKGFDVVKPTGQPTTYAIVGGSGFVGSYLIHALLRTWNVGKIYLLNRTLEKNDWLYKVRTEIKFVKMEVTQLEEVMVVIAKTSAEVVFLLSRFQDHRPHLNAYSHKVNVIGAENVLLACEAAPYVKYLALVSSSDGTLRSNKFWDLNEEDTQVLNETLSHYHTIKGIGEQMVPDFDGRGFRTITIRSGMFGGDGVLFDILIRHSTLPVDDGYQHWDCVENSAMALIVAADGLRSHHDRVGDPVFFVMMVVR
ncbi:hypothetical protein BJ742DRAFT_858458 [Cladochytrium replicatum]|nr:hypothetical protein BJ742DRAFT_858458 [Cladochytrium replicatum]